MMYEYIAGILLFYTIYRYRFILKNLINFGISKLRKSNITYKDNYAIIEIHDRGKNYKILLPYDPRTITTEISVDWGENEEFINHPKGIPFLVTPEKLGAKSIKVESLRKTKIYQHNETPII